jgi:undecaprenyl-diphosphatase
VKLNDLLCGAALAGAAVAVGAWSSSADGAETDAELLRAVNAGHGPTLDRFFFGVTELGSLWAAGASAMALALVGRRRAAGRAATAAAATWLVSQGTKELVRRPRPYDADAEATRLLIGRPPATSWPSSHPAVLTAFTGVVARELGLGPLARAALGGLDLSVAASRVYLGVHYPSDVAGGLLIGRAVSRLWPRS